MFGENVTFVPTNRASGRMTITKRDTIRLSVPKRKLPMDDMNALYAAIAADGFSSEVLQMIDI